MNNTAQTLRNLGWTVQEGATMVQGTADEARWPGMWITMDVGGASAILTMTAQHRGTYWLREPMRPGEAWAAAKILSEAAPPPRTQPDTTFIS